MQGMENSKKRSLLYVVIVAAIGGFLFGFPGPDGLYDLVDDQGE